jgi:chemotaxis protein MotB
MSRKKPQHQDEHENAERWLLTYADMITLLMAFFIMMFAMSQVDKAKFIAMAASVREELGAVALPSAPEGKINLDPARGAQGAGVTDGSAALLSRMVQREIAGAPDSKMVTVENASEGLVVRVQTDHLMFPPGRANISPGMAALLTRIAKALAQVPNSVHVEGHTCNLPVRKGEFSDNWELSAARATNVVLHFIRSCHLPPDRFVASGLADTHPLLPNTCEENRRCNRRIDIVLEKGSPDRRRGAMETITPDLGIAPALGGK